MAFLLIALVGRERSSGLAILLMGIAIESALSSVSSVLLLYTPAEASLSLADWMAGSLFQASWPTIIVLVPSLQQALPAFSSLAGRLPSSILAARWPWHSEKPSGIRDRSSFCSR